MGQGRALTINFRNGFGLDIEACDSRAVWISGDTFIGTKAACFDGIVLQFPFIVITFGIIYEHNENEEL